MHTQWWSSFAYLAGFAVLAVADSQAHAGEPLTGVFSSSETIERFRAAEQALMDAIATGDKAV